jgi:hypothetical protein
LLYLNLFINSKITKDIISLNFKLENVKRFNLLPLLIIFVINCSGQIRYGLVLGGGINSLSNSYYIKPKQDTISQYKHSFNSDGFKNLGLIVNYSKPIYLIQCGFAISRHKFKDTNIIKLSSFQIYNALEKFKSNYIAFKASIPISIHLNKKKFQIGIGITPSLVANVKKEVQYKLISDEDNLKIFVDSSYKQDICNVKKLITTSTDLYLGKSVSLNKNYSVKVQFFGSFDLFGTYPFIDQNNGTPFLNTNTVIKLEKANIRQNLYGLQLLLFKMGKK